MHDRPARSRLGLRERRLGAIRFAIRTDLLHDDFTRCRLGVRERELAAAGPGAGEYQRTAQLELRRRRACCRLGLRERRLGAAESPARHWGIISYQLSAISYQLSAISCQLSAVSSDENGRD